MIDAIVPAAVMTAESAGDIEVSSLPAQERDALPDRTGSGRLREFATGRWCAHTALERLGIPVPVIGRGLNQEPIWPRGAVGSITHCPRYRAAAAARADSMLTIGIDAEPHQPLPRRVLSRVTAETERRHLATIDDGMHHYDRILFSAKESVYKAWFPVARTRIGFLDVTMTFDPRAHTFCAVLMIGAPAAARRLGRSLHGWYLVRDGLIVTVVTVEAVRVRR